MPNLPLAPGARISPRGMLETIAQNAAPRSSGALVSSLGEVPASTGCVPSSTGSLENAQPRLMSEVDLKNLKEYWAERCMFEVMKLEGCIFDKMEQIEGKLERQIREMGQQQNSELRTLEERLQQQSESDAQKLQRRLETLRQEQRAETAEVLSNPSSRHLEVSVQVTQQQMQIDAMEASLADFRRELDGHLQYRNEQVDAVRIAEEKWSRLEVAHNEQAQAMREQAASLLAEHHAGMQEVSAAMEATKHVAATCQRLQSEAHANSSGEQANLLQQMQEVARQCRECNSKLQDVQQDHMCEIVTLKGRFEAATGEHDAKLTQLESITSHLKQDLSRTPSPEVEVAVLLKKRIETLSVDVAALSKRLEALAQERATPGEAKLNNDTAGLSSLREEFESLHSKCSQRLEPLESLQEDVALQGAAVRALKEQLESNGNQNSVSSLRAALTETRTDVGLLASQLAEEIQERQSGLHQAGQLKGQLTEEVSKSALFVMERLEQRLASELANERARTEQLVNQQMPRKDYLDRLAEVSTASGGSGDSDSIGASSELARNVGRIVGDMEAELRVQLTSRINTLQGELHSLQTEVAAHMGSLKVRLAAVESGAGAPSLQQLSGKPPEEFSAAAFKPDGRPTSSAADDACSSHSSRGTTELTAPRFGKTEQQDSATLEAIQERDASAGVIRSTSPKLASLLRPPLAAQESSQARKSGPTAAAQTLLSSDLKGTLENLAEAVQRTLCDGPPVNASRSVDPMGGSRGSGSMTLPQPANLQRRQEAMGSGSLTLSNPSNLQRRTSASQEARQTPGPSQQGTRSASNQSARGSSISLKVAERATSPKVSEANASTTRPPLSPQPSTIPEQVLGSSVVETVYQPSQEDGSVASIQVSGAGLSVPRKVERALSPKMSQQVGMASPKLSSSRLGSVSQGQNSARADTAGRQTTPSGRQSTQSADATASAVRGAMAARGATRMTSATSGEHPTDANAVGSRGRLTHSLQPSGTASSLGPNQSPTRSRQAQSAAPNLNPAGTMPLLGTAAGRVSSRPSGYPQTQPMPQSPVTQLHAAGRHPPSMHQTQSSM